MSKERKVRAYTTLSRITLAWAERCCVDEHRDMSDLIRHSLIHYLGTKYRKDRVKLPPEVADDMFGPSDRS